MNPVKADTGVQPAMARQEMDAVDLAKDNGIQFLQLVKHTAITAANGLT